MVRPHSRHPCVHVLLPALPAQCLFVWGPANGAPRRFELLRLLSNLCRPSVAFHEVPHRLVSNLILLYWELDLSLVHLLLPVQCHCLLHCLLLRGGRSGSSPHYLPQWIHLPLHRPHDYDLHPSQWPADHDSDALVRRRPSGGGIERSGRGYPLEHPQLLVRLFHLVLSVLLHDLYSVLGLHPSPSTGVPLHSHSPDVACDSWLYLLLQRKVQRLHVHANSCNLVLGCREHSNYLLLL